MRFFIVFLGVLVFLTSFSGVNKTENHFVEFPIDYRCSDKVVNSLDEMGFPEYISLYFNNEEMDLFHIDRGNLHPEKVKNVFEIDDIGQGNIVYILKDSSKIISIESPEANEIQYWLKKPAEDSFEYLINREDFPEIINFSLSGLIVRSRFIYEDLYEEGARIWDWHFSPVEVVDIRTGVTMELMPTPPGARIDDVFELDGIIHTIFHYDTVTTELWVINNITGEIQQVINDMPETGNEPNFYAHYQYGKIRLSIPYFEYSDKLYYREIEYPIKDNSTDEELFINPPKPDYPIYAAASTGNYSYINIWSFSFLQEKQEEDIYLFDLSNQQFTNHCITYNPEIEEVSVDFLPSRKFATINFRAIDELTNLRMIVINLETGEYLEIDDARFFSWSLRYVIGEGYNFE